MDADSDAFLSSSSKPEEVIIIIIIIIKKIFLVQEDNIFGTNPVRYMVRDYKGRNVIDN